MKAFASSTSPDDCLPWPEHDGGMIAPWGGNRDRHTDTFRSSIRRPDQGRAREDGGAGEFD